ncbi:MAG: preprotein translocase subunit SecE [Myxococcota bacterium]|jgi:preprotein translocase subunit SecE
MSVARYVNLSYVVIGLIAYLIFAELISAVLGLFGTGSDMALIGINFKLSSLLGMAAAVGLAVFLKKSEKISTYAMEVGNELSKVTWPTWSETKLATIVVIITTLIIAAILGLLDLAWGGLSNLLYS